MAARHGTVPAEPVRVHVELLLAGGMSIGAISRQAPCNVRTVRDIIGRDGPPRPQVMRETAERLLAVRRMPSRVLVDGTGTRRRLEALMAIGWPARVLADQLGGSVYDGTGTFLPAGASSHSGRHRRHTYGYVAEAVRRLYAQLADQPGPRQDLGARYQARGYLGPLWWDDDNIDDPGYDPLSLERDREPDPMAVERAVMGCPPETLSREERLLAVARIRQCEDLPDELVGARVGVSARQIQRDLRTLGLPGYRGGRRKELDLEEVPA